MYIVNQDECVGCCGCVECCSENAFYMTSEERLAIDETKCNMCGFCAVCCPIDCIYDDGEGIPQEQPPTSIFSSSDFWSVLPSWLNVPFVYGGESVNGADCSGLLWGIYNDMGLYYDRCGTSEFSNNPHWFQVDSPLPGDIIVWPGHHSMLYYPYGSYDGISALATANGARSGWACTSWFSIAYGNPIYFRYRR
ncbi:MAG: NlpC/P60 family protein [Bacteroidota bacterium]